VQERGVDARGRRTSISQDRLLEMLAEVEPGLPAAIQSFLDRAGDLGVVLEPAPKSLHFRWRGPEDQSFALGGIDEYGRLLTYNVGWMADYIGHLELAHEYLEKIAALVGGEVRKTPIPARWSVALKGTRQAPSVMALLTRQDQWQAVIEEYTAKLRAALIEAGGL
jgi:hypothetical protein